MMACVRKFCFIWFTAALFVFANSATFSDASTLNAGNSGEIAGNILHVNVESGNDDNDGSTGENALKSIQKAIDLAIDGDTVIVHPGVYKEDLHFSGKNIILTSIDPLDSEIVRNTSIGGDYLTEGLEHEAVITFCGNEGPDCFLTGFNINGHVLGFDEEQSQCNEVSRATISHCTFIGNCGDCGGSIEYCAGLISHCVFADNLYCVCGLSGTVNNCTGLIENCTFANNQTAVSIESEKSLKIINCIFSRNPISIGFDSTLNISYSNLYMSSVSMDRAIFEEWGPGIIRVDPNFVSPGYEIDSIFDFPFPMPGEDYHLMSQGGRWDASSGKWVYDDITSPCIDAGSMEYPIGQELFPNGGIINMGAYGGTTEASRSYFGAKPCETIIASDINGDCTVSLDDFMLMAYHWLEEKQ